MDVLRRNSIGRVKTLIQRKEGIPPHPQTLAYGVVQLDYPGALAYYSVENKLTLILLVDDDGSSITRELQIHVKNIGATGKIIDLEVRSSRQCESHGSRQGRYSRPPADTVFAPQAAHFSNDQYSISRMILLSGLSKLLICMKAKILGKEILADQQLALTLNANILNKEVTPFRLE